MTREQIRQIKRTFRHYHSAIVDGVTIQQRLNSYNGQLIPNGWYDVYSNWAKLNDRPLSFNAAIDLMEEYFARK